MKSTLTMLLVAVAAVLFLTPEMGVSQSGRGYLGINSEKVTRKIITKYSLPVDYGAYVSSVVDGSAAEEAGIQEHDVIVGIGDEKIYDTDDLTSAIRHCKPYTDVKVDIYRKGEKKTLTAKVDRLKSSGYSFSYNSHSNSNSHSWLGDIFSRNSWHEDISRGVEAQDITRQLGEYFGVPDGRGVLITEVHKGGIVDKAGFKAGDVVTKVDGRYTDEVSELIDIIEEREGKEVSVEFVRDRKPLTLTLKVPSEDEDWD